MARHRILVVDHEPLVTGLVSSVLSKDGYKTLVVHSSSEAIQQAPSFASDLVVIDPIMPGVSGLETAAQIAKATQSRILFLTALCDDREFREELRGMQQQGCRCGALPKPIVREQLLDYVRRDIGPVAAESESI